MKPRALPEYAEKALLVTSRGLKGYQRSGEPLTITWKKVKYAKVHHAGLTCCGYGYCSDPVCCCYNIATFMAPRHDDIDELHDPELACWMTGGVLWTLCALFVCTGEILCCAQNIPNYTRLVVGSRNDELEVIALKEDASDVMRILDNFRDHGDCWGEVATMDIDTARKELERDDLDKATQGALNARIKELEGVGDGSIA